MAMQQHSPSFIKFFLIQVLTNPRKFKFYNFYYKNLRSYKFFRYLAKYSYILTCYLLRKILDSSIVPKKSFHLVRLKYFIKNKGIKKSRLIKLSTVKTIPPNFIPLKRIFFEKNEYPVVRFPEIYVARINKAFVIGGSNFLIKDEEIVSHDLLNVSFDLTPEERHLRMHLKGSFLNLNEKFFTEKVASIGTAASFTDALSMNYAHWITEVLPRIVSFCSNSKYKKVPIIIDDGLHKNIMETLKNIVGQRQVFLLPKNRIVKIGKLYSTSVAGYISYEPRNIFNQGSSSGKFNANAIKLLVRLLKPLGVKNTPSKIYVRRNSSYRNLTNQNEIEALLRENEFKIVDTEKLSFFDQISYFSNAKVIIAPTGAALANLIFCNKKVNLAILANDDRNMIYKYWVNLASIVGVKVTYITGKSQQFFGGIHRDFYIDLNSIDAYIKLLRK